MINNSQTVINIISVIVFCLFDEIVDYEGKLDHSFCLFFLVFLFGFSFSAFFTFLFLEILGLLKQSLPVNKTSISYTFGKYWKCA